MSQQNREEEAKVAEDALVVLVILASFFYVLVMAVLVIRNLHANLWSNSQSIEDAKARWMLESTNATSPLTATDYLKTVVHP